MFSIAARVEGAFDAAEPHFLAAGKRDSARLLADMFIQWSTAGGSRDVFALRGTIPYASQIMEPFPTYNTYIVICRTAISSLPARS